MFCPFFAVAALIYDTRRTRASACGLTNIRVVLIRFRVWTLLRSGTHSATLTRFPPDRPAFRHNSRPCSYFLPAMIPGNSPVSPRHIFPENPVTARISMKTTIKLRKPFFPSCIMDLGTLASPDFAACGETPARLPYTLAPDSCARGSSLPCRLPRLGSLTTA
jgi:hypothetical protein